MTVSHIRCQQIASHQYCDEKMLGIRLTYRKSLLVCVRPRLICDGPVGKCLLCILGVALCSAAEETIVVNNKRVGVLCNLYNLLVLRMF